MLHLHSATPPFLAVGTIGVPSQVGFHTLLVELLLAVMTPGSPVDIVLAQAAIVHGIRIVVGQECIEFNNGPRADVPEAIQKNDVSTFLELLEENFCSGLSHSFALHIDQQIQTIHLSHLVVWLGSKLP